MAEARGIEKRVDELERKLGLVIETQRQLIGSMRERRLISQNGYLPIERAESGIDAGVDAPLPNVTP